MYWLSALSMPEALREGLQMFGLWSEELGGPVQRVFNPSDRVAWVAVDPKSLEPPFLGLCPVSRQVALVVEHLCGPNQ